jgi:hypothetical protein
MRTFILVAIVAFAVACGVAYAVGLVEVATNHPEGKYVATLTVNTALLHHEGSAADPNAAPGKDNDNSTLDVRGKITDVRTDKNEVVVSENVKNWTFQLAKDGKVFINDRESKLAELQAGDDAVVTFDRLGSQLLASVIRSTRQ